MRVYVCVTLSHFLSLFPSVCGKSLCAASALSQRRPEYDEMKALVQCSSQPAMLEMFIRRFLFAFDVLNLTVALEFSSCIISAVSPFSPLSPLFASIKRYRRMLRKMNPFRPYDRLCNNPSTLSDVNIVRYV